jgi:hypothetical protein
VSRELFPGGRSDLTREAPAWPGVRLFAMRLDLGDARGVTVSILVDSSSRSHDMTDLVSCVERILNEPVLTRAAA